jgi:hypothetical protein
MYYVYYWCESQSRWREAEEHEFEFDDYASACLAAQVIARRRGTSCAVQDGWGTTVWSC